MKECGRLGTDVARTGNVVRSWSWALKVMEWVGWWVCSLMDELMGELMDGLMGGLMAELMGGLISGLVGELMSGLVGGLMGGLMVGLMGGLIGEWVE